METLDGLWKSSVKDTPWEELNLTRELQNVEVHAKRPRLPADHLIFRIFRAFRDPRRIKVVLLGQDPYPEILHIKQGGEDLTVSRACGFSFSSPYGSLPLSLRRVFVEILREYPQPPVGKRAVIASDFSGDLSYLVAEGVFLLNTLLTIEFDGTRGLPDSHRSWVAFTTQILSFIHRKCPKVVFLALGKKAADILKASDIPDAIETDHPANRFSGRHPFVGSDIFIQTNERLKKRGLTPVDWIPMLVAVDTEYHKEDEDVRELPPVEKLIDQVVCPIPTTDTSEEEESEADSVEE